MFDETYDRTKSQWTKEARGVDFLEVRVVCNDPEAIEGPATMKDNEERWLKVGRIEDKLWTIGFTYRSEGIRIFMARPAREDEGGLLWPLRRRNPSLTKKKIRKQNYAPGENGSNV